MFARITREWQEITPLRLIWRVFVLVFLVALAGFGIWTLSPLFYNRTVNETFPISQSQPATTSQSATQPMAQSATGASASTSSAPSEDGVVGKGSFSGADSFHQAEGAAAIYRLADGKLVLRLEDFRVTNGPDLFIALSGHPRPRTGGEVHDGGYEQLLRLKANQGNQNYELPEGIDVRGVRSVVIYCRTFRVVFGSAEIVPQAS
ncbi:MAG: DM13 domain-containing protein [Chloroflexota bacterium]